MECYVEADWGQCADTRRSYSGLVVTLSGSPISWESKKQNCVTLSSCEAEYVAAVQAAKEVWFLSQVVEELGMGARYGSKGFKIHCDDRGPICMASNTGYSPRSKHIDIRFHYLRELVSKSIIDIHYIPTAENLADIFTKGLGDIKHNYFLKKLLSMPIEGAC